MDPETGYVVSERTNGAGHPDYEGKQHQYSTYQSLS